MEDSTSFTLEPSLQHMATATIGIHLWTSVRPLTPNDDLEYMYEVEEEYRLREKVRNLPLPPLLKKQLSIVIPPIGNQISDWYRYLFHEARMGRVEPKELRWTNKGTIDARKSALVLVKNPSLLFIQRYKIACTFCLKDEIIKLFKKIPENALNALAKQDSQKMVAFWTNELKRKDHVWSDENNELSYLQIAFRWVASDANVEASKYFFDLLSSEEQNTELNWFAKEALGLYFVDRLEHIPKEFCREMVAVFLSRMNRDQREKLFGSNVNPLLLLLLEWPYYGLFIEIVDRAWEFLREKNFVYLLLNIVCASEYINCDYRAVHRHLFRRVWGASPIEYRAFAIDNPRFRDKLYEYFELERKMGNEAENDEEEKAFEECVCESVICEQKWNFLRFFLEECAMSEKQMDRIDQLMIGGDWSTKNERKKEFFIILDTVILNGAKNNNVEN